MATGGLLAGASGEPVGGGGGVRGRIGVAELRRGRGGRRSGPGGMREGTGTRGGQIWEGRRAGEAVALKGGSRAHSSGLWAVAPVGLEEVWSWSTNRTRGPSGGERQI